MPSPLIARSQARVMFPREPLQPVIGPGCPPQTTARGSTYGRIAADFTLDASLVQADYPTGFKVSDAAMKQLRLCRHDPPDP